MKKLALILIAGVAMLGVAHAEAEKHAKHVEFEFQGPFGKFDKGQLQRGLKVYKEVCSGCHSLRLVSFRNLADRGGPGYTEEQVKEFAKSIKITELNDKGESITRPGLPSDYFPSPFATPEAAAASLGAAPPDLSLITKAREGWHGTFNQLWNGIGGPQYVYSVLTGFEKPTAEQLKEAPKNKNFNPYAETGPWISMAAPLSDGQVTFDDGAPNKVDDMAKDVAAFLAWTAEPKMEERKQLGFQTLIFLLVLAGLLYAYKRRVWSDVH